MKLLNRIIVILSVLFCVMVCYVVYSNPAVESVDIYKEAYELFINDETYIDVRLYPTNVKKANCVVVWESSQTDIATVDNNGKVKAKAAGRSTITVNIDGMTDSCEVVVRPIEVENINLSCEYTKISINETMSINSIIAPANATIKTIVWSSSNPEILSVDDLGNVVGLSVGTAAITATANNGVFKTISIEVSDKIFATSININKSSMEIYRDKRGYLECSFAPLNTTEKVVEWSSSNAAIATVDATTGVVTGIKQGNVTIVGRYVDGRQVTCSVTVKEIKANMVSATNGLSFVGMKVGDSITMQLKLLPTNTTDKISDIEFESQDTSVAVVSDSGIVTAVGTGDTYIILRIDGEAIGFINVFVQ